MITSARIVQWLLFVSLTALTACGGGSSGPQGPVATTPLVIVAFGDSLTDENSGFVTPGSSWVAKLQRQISTDGVNSKQSVTVINAGIGGETTRDALARLPGVLAQYRPTHIFLAHGTNDLWQCYVSCFESTQTNLERMAQMSKSYGAQIIMTDITLKSFGDGAAASYSAMHRAVAADNGTNYIQLIDGVAYDDSHYWTDGVHLRDSAQEQMKNNAVKALYPLIK